MTRAIALLCSVLVLAVVSASAGRSAQAKIDSVPLLFSAVSVTQASPTSSGEPVADAQDLLIPDGTSIPEGKAFVCSDGVAGVCWRHLFR